MYRANNRHSAAIINRAVRGIAAPSRCALETLEGRKMMCQLAHFSPSVIAQDAKLEHARAEAAVEAGTAGKRGRAATFDIAWTNRGNDNFGPIFGDRAEAARNVVDAVMQMWENIIIDMHDQGGRNRIDVDVYMDSDVTGFGGLARIQDTEFGFPVRGDIEIGNGNAAIAKDRGWFVDDSPLDSSEFAGPMINAFAAIAQQGSTALNLPDLFTVINSEMVHLLGITSQADTHWVDQAVANGTGTADGNEGGGIGQLYYVKTPTINQLMTTYNSGNGGTDTGEPLHTSPGFLFVEPAVGTIFGSEDAGNAAYESATRYLPPNNIAQLLEYGYGYEVRQPELQGTFYGLLRDTGELLVRGGADSSNDLIDVYRDLSTNEIVISVDIGTDIPGTGPTDAFISRYPAARVSTINIQGGGGKDTINVNTNVNLPTTIDLGAGNDLLAIHGKSLGIGGTMSINVIGLDDGTDTLELISERSGDTVDVNNNGITHSGGFTVNSTPNFENLVIGCHFGQTNIKITRSGTYESLRINGSTLADTIYIDALPLNLRAYIYAGSGSDIIRLGWAAGQELFSTAQVYGEGGDDIMEVGNGTLGQLYDGAQFVPGPGVDTVIFHDEHNAAGGYTGTDYALTPEFVTTYRNGALVEEYYVADVEVVKIGGDSGNNRFTVAANLPARVDLRGYDGNDIFDGAGTQAATVYGGNGDDEFVLGNGNLAPSASLVSAYGEAGNDAITFDDHLSAFALPWTINGDTGLPTQRRVFLGINEYSYGGFERVGILGGPLAQEFRFNGNFDVGLNVNAGGGNDTLTVGFGATAADFYRPVTLSGGAGNDTFNWRNRSSNWSNFPGIGGQPSLGEATVTLDGNAGYNSVSVEDSIRADSNYVLTDSRLTVYESSFLTFGSDFFYDNMAAMGITCGNGGSGTNQFVVTGVSSDIDIGNQVTIQLGIGADNAFIYPRDAAGNLTINGNIGIIGSDGVDNLTIEDSAATSGINYVFSNPFGAGTQTLYGLGARPLGTATLENWHINTGSGNDTFAVNQFMSGVAATIQAGAGDDSLTIGNGNVRANVTAIGPFTFDGQAGTDTLTVAHGNANTEAFSYVRDTSYLRIASVAGGYAFRIQDPNVEASIVNSGGGNAAESVEVIGLRSGATFAASMGTGTDLMRLGRSIVTSPNDLETIQGRVSYSAGSAGGRVEVWDTADTTGDAFHLTQTSLAALPGDSLFGPGGSLFFSGLKDASGIAVAMSINCGSGSDTAFAAPLPSGTTVINLNGQSRTNGGRDKPGDALNLALALASNYILNDTNPSSGSVSSDSTGILRWTGLELGLTLDDVAPSPLSAEYLFDSALPALSFSFDDNVSATLSLESLTLLDLATGESLYTRDFAITYDLFSNVATMTFPNGALPDGNYQAILQPGYSDSFGNGGSASISVDFFALAGDANRDRVVNFDDLLILAQNYGTSGRRFSQGNFDYSSDGLVGFDDLLLLAQRYGRALFSTASIAAAPASSGGKRWRGVAANVLQ